MGVEETWVRAVLARWDPIGVFRNEGGPVDEYDDLIQPILHALGSCPSSSALAEVALRALGSHPGHSTGPHTPGVVLVWRGAEGVAAHAAVTVGDGYALSKPSQAWCSPCLVWTVRETITAVRYRDSRFADSWSVPVSQSYSELG